MSKKLLLMNETIKRNHLISLMIFISVLNL